MAPTKRPVDLDAIFRGAPAPVPRVRAISSTDRLLKPTKASLAALRDKVLTGKDKEVAEARKVAQKRRRLARVAKENGHLTIPQSPKFRKIKKYTARSRADMLTRTSRELLEIAAIRKRVQAQKRKTQKYHDATTHGAAPGKSAQFSKALSASGASASQPYDFRSLRRLWALSLRLISAQQRQRPVRERVWQGRVMRRRRRRLKMK
ncbi:hypothetical protein GN244_ATG15797 [Phytophthora infestans]|uniref:Uncharacterized protein n=1 Tax=Phytophthora infestans TaxID=4787 RepID=A0A833SC31_PHYIN|nr:hypothetical protein GN244_ATG15797 [Phytophthora infestans]